MEPPPPNLAQLARFVLQDGLAEIKDKEQIHQITKVLRLKSGDRLIGLELGRQYLLELSTAGKATLGLNILNELPAEPGQELPFHLTLCLPLLKGEKTDWVIQKCTELGVHTFQFIQFERTVRQNINFEHKATRWRKICQEAVEQSERLHMPELKEPIDLKSLNLSTDCKALVFLERSSPFTSAAALKKKSEKMFLAFGPEGGFSEDEKMQLLSKGFQSVSLGRRILRSETAIIAGVSLLGAMQGL